MTRIPQTAKSQLAVLKSIGMKEMEVALTKKFRSVEKRTHILETSEQSDQEEYHVKELYGCIELTLLKKRKKIADGFEVIDNLTRIKPNLEMVGDGFQNYIIIYIQLDVVCEASGLNCVFDIFLFHRRKSSILRSFRICTNK